jgi:hypothetical protein
MPAFLSAGGNKEIIIGMAYFRILKQILHIGNNNLLTPVEFVVPESLGPSHILYIHTSEFDVPTYRGIG